MIGLHLTLRLLSTRSTLSIALLLLYKSLHCLQLMILSILLLTNTYIPTYYYYYYYHYYYYYQLYTSLYCLSLPGPYYTSLVSFALLQPWPLRPQPFPQRTT